jgi:hypothetical protein
MIYAPPEPASDGTPAEPGRAASRRGLGCALEIAETLVLTQAIPTRCAPTSCGSAEVRPRIAPVAHVAPGGTRGKPIPRTLPSASSTR